MDRQDVRMSSVSPIPVSEHGDDDNNDNEHLHPSSHGHNNDIIHHHFEDEDEQGLDGDVEFHSTHSRAMSPSAESISTGAASSDEEEEEDDEEVEGGEHVDENGAIVIDDDEDEDDRGGESGEEGEEAAANTNGKVVVVGPSSPTSKSISIPVLLNQKPPSLSTTSTAKQKKSRSPSSHVAAAEATNGAPASSAAAGGSQKPVSTAKPKSKAKPRSPSPLPVAPPPLQTIRLEIRLGGPDNYEVDISKQAKETGQRPPTPVQKRAETSESEGEDDEGKVKKVKGPGKEQEVEGEKPKKKKKKNAASEYYDVSDPFIDDSELALDDRKFFAQTKQTGFYVSSGEVALMKDRTPKKVPKSTKKTPHPHPIHTNLEAGPSSLHHRAHSNKAEGTKESPIALMDDDDDSTRLPFMSHPHHGDDAAAASTSKGPPNDRRKKTGNATAAGSGSHNGGSGGGGGPFNASAKTTSTSTSSTSVPHGTGLNAPLSNNLGITRKLNWTDPDPEPDPGDEQYGTAGDKIGTKRKRVTYSYVTDNGKKRKVVDIASFHPTLQASFAKLKQAIAAESWETKGKFPPSIKPILAEVALQAIKLDQYDEHFFNLMPVLFPYNKFTMSKLIKRTVFAEHIALLVERQDALLAELERQAQEGFARAKEEWEKNVSAWDKRQKKLKAEQRAYTGGGTPIGGEESASNGPTRHPSEDHDNLEEGDLSTSTHPPPPPGSQGLAAMVSDRVAAANGANGANGGGGGGGGEKGGADKDAQPPAKKFRLTESMKAIVWELVLLSNECCRLENEKNTLEGSIMQVSEQGLRKVLYQKIVAAFPTGWMSSGQISRDVSAMKKKLEKEQLEHEQEE